MTNQGVTVGCLEVRLPFYKQEGNWPESKRCRTEQGGTIESWSLVTFGCCPTRAFLPDFFNIVIIFFFSANKKEIEKREKKEREREEG